MSKSGDGFGLVLVELKGVWESSGSCKGTRRDPEGFLFVENPSVVGCEVGGAIRGRKWSKLIAGVPGGEGGAAFSS